MLPVTKTSPKQDLASFTMLWYGKPKTGKTSTAAQNPKALFLATEPGQSAVECYRMECYKWGAFTDAVKEIYEASTAGKLAFDTIVIDTLDRVWSMCEDVVVADANEPSINMGKLGYGNGYKLVANKVMRILRMLASLPQGLIIITHAVSEDAVDMANNKIVRVFPALPDMKNISPRAEVLGFVDMIGYFHVLNERDATGSVVSQKHLIAFAPGDTYEAGDRTGRLPKLCPANWEAITAAWNAATKKEK